VAGPAIFAIRTGIDWVIADRRRRVVATAIFWLVVLAVLLLAAERDVWLGVVLGALLPVSVWVAWEGFTIPRNPRLDYFLALTPQEFEEVVAELVVPLGYTDVRVVGGANDRGVDVLCRDREGRKVAIQCKRYRPANDVSSPEVQKFIGSMVLYDADRGIIVTTSTFSAPAQQLARDQQIRLIDGAELSRMLARQEVAPG
jgi:restriction system protein